MKKLITVKEAAASLSSSEKTVRRLIASGHLKACKIRGALRVDAKSMEEYVTKQLIYPELQLLLQSSD